MRHKTTFYGKKMIWLSQRKTLRYQITFSLEYNIRYILPLLVTQKRPFLRVIFGQNVHIIYDHSVHFNQYKLLQSLYFIKYSGVKLFFNKLKINFKPARDIFAIYRYQHPKTGSLVHGWFRDRFFYFLGADAGTLYFSFRARQRK
jgi:hypothetical protein